MAPISDSVVKFTVDTEDFCGRLAAIETMLRGIADVIASYLKTEADASEASHG